MILRHEGEMIILKDQVDYDKLPINLLRESDRCTSVFKTPNRKSVFFYTAGSENTAVFIAQVACP